MPDNMLSRQQQIQPKVHSTVQTPKSAPGQALDRLPICQSCMFSVSSKHVYTYLCSAEVPTILFSSNIVFAHKMLNASKFESFVNIRLHAGTIQVFS